MNPSNSSDECPCMETEVGRVNASCVLLSYDFGDSLKSECPVLDHLLSSTCRTRIGLRPKDNVTR